MDLKVGDIVSRKSYGGDVFFKVVDIKRIGKETTVVLKGISYRIEADAPESDLMLMSDQHVNDHNKRLCSTVCGKCRGKRDEPEKGSLKKIFLRSTSKDNPTKFFRTGKVLHIDGDNDYMGTCLEHYKKFGLDAVGRHIPEKDQPAKIYKLLVEINPDILVLTGHDGFAKGDNGYSFADLRNR